MAYTVKLIKQIEQTTSSWSGGTTTQIAIYPPDASYSEKNFSWRLSSASVEVEASTFTPLPGIWRLLMVIAGELELTHAGHHTVHLRPFEQDSFSGAWTTTSHGKVRDFNLMLAAGCAGQLMAISLKETGSEQAAHQPAAGSAHLTSAFYCVTGRVRITIDNQALYQLQQGDLLLLSTPGDVRPLPVTIFNTGNGQAQIIKTRITY
ncbi:HutD/Ves family protein [Sporomusa termitida]|uniref:HutD n=1 Tax=Sporomusa termitida TaxID=2377 RepID=A0A517DRI8_9FIRM|nr:HutD family protein [Sporomusa termitida]QDR79971.1 HutD [Sporomusa termitida]